MKELILKVNPEKNIEELGKYLHKVNILGVYDAETDGEQTIEGVYACVSYPEYIENGEVIYYDINFYINKDGEIDYCCYPEQRDTDVILFTIYDLVKADLLVKEVK